MDPLPEVTEEENPFAAELAKRTVRATFPDVAITSDSDTMFNDAFMTACEVIHRGEKSGESATATFDRLASALPSWPALEQADYMMAFAVQTFLLYEGCGYSSLAREVRSLLLDKANKALAR